MPYNLPRPAISDAEITRIRSAAHSYLLAGGYLFREGADGIDVAGHDEHVATIRERVRPKAERAFSAALDQVCPGNTDESHRHHEQLYSAAWQLVTAESEAAYLFGVCVGLEVASLVGRGAPVTVGRDTNGGAR